MGGEPSKILAEPPLFHGGANVLRDPEWFRRTRVTHTLSVCSQKPPVAFELQQVRQIDVADLPGVSLVEHFEDICFFIHTARTSPGTVVYVHCAAGVSRSSTAVICYLIGVHGISFREAIDFVRTRREVAFPNPGFTQQLQTFERDPGTAALRARIRAAFPHDVAMVERDLVEIQEALAGLRARLAAGERPFDPRDRILEVMQAAQDRVDLGGDGDADEEEEEEGAGGGNKAGGSAAADDNGGWGLTWVEEERTHHTRTDELPR